MIERYPAKVARDSDRYWRLYARARDILDGRATGHALPILRALAVRQFPPAQNTLSDFLGSRDALALLRRAAAQGDDTARYNIAIECRNRGDLRHYRYWLSRAARFDPDARSELRQFRRRFPHTIMKQFRMFAPERRD